MMKRRPTRFLLILAFAFVSTRGWSHPTPLSYDDSGEQLRSPARSGPGDGSGPVPPLRAPPIPKPKIGKHRPKSLKILPLPIYATLPNEGSTWGLMPVFVVVDALSARTESIYAPSVSWNRVIGTTGTFRWFNYPSPDRSFTFTASGSTHINWGGNVIWNDEPRDLGKLTQTVFLRWQRSVFFRFFGVGPETPESAESSHTRVRANLWYRLGWNLRPNVNLGARLEIARDVVQPETAPGYPSSPYVFPSVPGMGSGSVLSELIDLQYDTRENHDYSVHGHFIDMMLGPAQGLGSSPAYWIGQVDARQLIPEFRWLTGGARFFLRYVTSPQVPFYYQSTLGGSFLLRGFTEDRFIDQGAWTAEFEQRVRVFQTHIYGVTTDWRLDPFMAIGQVFHPGTGPISHVRLTGGLGFRAWVRPNVLGRVDLGYGGEGPKFYVELGYPF